MNNRPSPIPQNSATEGGDAQIADLIARLEKATVPDRGLDALIATSLGWRSRSYIHTAGYRVVEWFNQDGRTKELPLYTSSIDAALTLVPEGFEWHVEMFDNRFMSRVHHPYDDAEMQRGATPAIALCIAALKSRSTP